MPKSYFEAMSELQQRGFEAMKVAQTTQLATLQAGRALTASAARLPIFGMAPAVREMGEMTTSFTFALIEQQLAYAGKVAAMLAPAPRTPTAPPAHEALAESTIQAFEPLTDIPVDATPLEVDVVQTMYTADDVARADDVAHAEEATTVSETAHVLETVREEVLASALPDPSELVAKTAFPRTSANAKRRTKK